MLLLDRVQAGRELAKILGGRWRDRDVLVLAVDSGGVPVACQIARALAVPVDVFLAHELATPGHPGTPMGMVMSDGVCVLELEVLTAYNVSDGQVANTAAREFERLLERQHRYRGERPAQPLAGRALIVADDGLTPRAIMLAALRELRRQEPRAILVATVTATTELDEEIADLTDEMVCVGTTDLLWSDAELGHTSDEEVRAQLDAAQPG